jgi:hypothetical protein
MDADQIEVMEFCLFHNADESFVISLCDSGLINLIVIDDKKFIPVSEVDKLEKFFRFYYDLNINLEGIETISHLQYRIEEMREQLQVLKNRLRFYENSE